MSPVITAPFQSHRRRSAIIDLIVALSTLAFTIAVFNAGVRYLFAMGRESMLRPVFAPTGRYKTPDVARA